MLNANKELVRSKLKQIFSYLKELNTMRIPTKKNIKEHLWFEWLDNFPVHPDVEFGFEFKSEVSNKIEDIEDFVVKVRKPKMEKCPIPPEEIKDWLIDDWENVNLQKVRVLVLKDEKINDKLKMINFVDNQKRQELLNKWLDLRDEWIEKRKSLIPVMKLYEKFYDLYSIMANESEKVELILGDGILNYRKNGLDIKHPLLFQRVQLIFDTQVPEFTVIETDSPIEFYSSIFTCIDSIIPNYVADFKKDLNESDIVITNKDRLLKYFQRVVSAISSKGYIIDRLSEKNEKGLGDVFIERNPILFLRQKIAGYEFSIDSILEDLNETSEIPESLANVVGIELNAKINENDQGNLDIYHNINGEDEEILFSKEANFEQLQIAKKLEKNGAVLVQGPPGTGKTHTIANLIGHLLAEGKSVLVTSHTSKALKVLNEKIVKPLQPLCVSLLDDKKTQMEKSIDGITEYISMYNHEDLQKEASSLLVKRKRILDRISILRNNLLEIKRNEYKAIKVGEQDYDVVYAAKFVAENRDKFAFISSPVTLGKALPLSNQEFTILYATNLSVSKEEEREITEGVIDLAYLYNPNEFKKLCLEYFELNKSDLTDEHVFWNDNLFFKLKSNKELYMGKSEDELFKFIIENDSQINQYILKLKALMDEMKEKVKVLHNDNWQMDVIADGMYGKEKVLKWEKIINESKEIIALASEIELLNIEYNPVIPEEFFNNETLLLLEDMKKSCEEKGNINKLKLFFNPKWKKIIETVEINGKSPEDLKHYEALVKIIKLAMLRKEFLIKFQRLVGNQFDVDLDKIEVPIESLVSQVETKILSCLSWYHNEWRDMEEKIKQFGFDLVKFYNEQPIEVVKNAELKKIYNSITVKLPEIIDSRIKSLNIEKTKFNIELRTKIIDMLVENKSEDVISLRDSLLNYDFSRYEEFYLKLNALYKKIKDIEKRKELLSKLEIDAPVWATQIRGRMGVHGKDTVPGDLNKAWLFRQFEDELGLRLKTSIDDIQNEKEKLSNELRITTAELIEKMAWGEQIKKISLSQKQALIGWKDLVKKIGKGTGKNAPKYRKEAKKLMLECQSAVPVWIMPMTRVVENFDAKKNKFDVVIIDEASQADIMAFIMLYFGKNVLVVGDDEQVSPLSIGMDVEKIQKLIEMYLTDIPNAILYDGETSIYDIAKSSFDPICLREHFRCVSPIIEFSNQLSYYGKIKPLRESGLINRKPHTIAVKVENAISEGKSKVNKVEAVHIAALLKACTQEEEYRGASFGVICLVGEKQASIVDSILKNVIDESEYIDRRIQCGNSAQFQGDERDVIFLSVVDSSNGAGPLRLRSFGPGNAYKKRYNVAASRGRDQLWVVYSLDPVTDLKQDDLRLMLINHVNNPFVEEAETKEIVFQSDFEKEIYQILSENGYNVIVQWEVGEYKIDMIVLSNDRKIAIECDGDKFLEESKIEEDMMRQSILERLGWTFVRMRASQYYCNKKGVIEWLLSKLKDNEIYPMEKSNADQNGDLKDRIIKNAGIFIAEWEKSGLLRQLKLSSPAKVTRDKENDQWESSIEDIMSEECESIAHYLNIKEPGVFPM